MSILTAPSTAMTSTGNSYEQFIRLVTDWWPRARVWCLILFKALSSLATSGQRPCSTIAPVVSRGNAASWWIFKQWNKIWGTPKETFATGGPKGKETWKSGVDGESQGRRYWYFDRSCRPVRKRGSGGRQCCHLAYGAGLHSLEIWHTDHGIHGPLMDQGNDNFADSMCEPPLKRATQVPNLGQHNLFYRKRPM